MQRPFSTSCVVHMNVLKRTMLNIAFGSGSSIHL